MFVSFLLPYIDRGAGPLYHWIMLAQMAKFSPGEIVFLADRAYFEESTIPYGEELSIGTFSFICPDEKVFKEHQKIVLSRTSLESLYDRSKNHLDVFREVLTRRISGLTEEIDQALMRVYNVGEIEAFLTWCNCPSLNEVAQRLGVPVIHNEIGPLRGELYRDTAYFDFQGVNGQTTPSSWTSTENLVKELSGINLMSPAQIRGVLVRNHHRFENISVSEIKKTFGVGVALQVQDDSNAIAFSNGWNDIRLLYEAISSYSPEDVLVRSHPLARLTYRGGLGVADDSADSLEFLARVKRVQSINSSVLAEAALWEVPFRALGDCSFRCLAEDFPGGQGGDDEKRTWLNAFFLGYLIPGELLFNVEYYRWRLSEGPSLGQLVEKHLTIYKGLGEALPALGASDTSTSPSITRFAASWTQKMSLPRRLKIAEATIERLVGEIEAKEKDASKARNWQSEAERVWESHEWLRHRIEELDGEHRKWHNALNNFLSTSTVGNASTDRSDTDSLAAAQLEQLAEIKRAFAEELALRKQLESEIAGQKEVLANLREELKIKDERHEEALGLLRGEKEDLISRVEVELDRMKREWDVERSCLEMELGRMKSIAAESGQHLESLEKELVLWQGRATDLTSERSSLDARIEELESLTQAARAEQESIHAQSLLLRQQLELITGRLEKLYVSRLSLKERVLGRINNLR